MSEKSGHWLNHYNLLMFEEIDSTNEEAKRLAKSGVSGNFVIWSKAQSAGKGSHGRYWNSAYGNLYLSLLIWPNFKAKQAAQLSLLTAVSISNFLTKFNKDDKLIQHKWPNDVLINDKKFAGILLESAIKNNIVDWLIIGVGINLVSAPNLCSYQTTYLHKEGYSKLLLDQLLNEFMKSFDYYFNKWLQEGFEDIRKEWLAKCLKLNEVITISVGRERISGVLEDLTSEGYLKLVLPGGQICFVSAGEILYNIHQPNN